jgi:hypothetical protein
MVQRKVAIEVCDRCAFGKAKPATEERKVTIDGVTTRLVLCEPHASNFDRDLFAWTRNGEEIETEAPRLRSAYFNAERQAEARRIVELRSRAQQQHTSGELAKRRLEEMDQRALSEEEQRIYRSIPGALNWRLTTHAAERMLERGFDVAAVLNAAARPNAVIRQPWRGEDIAVHCVEDCRVVVNDRTKAIITVINRSDRVEIAPPATERKAQ